MERIPARKPRPHNGRFIFGIILIAAGTFALLHNLRGLAFFRYYWDFIWPLGLIGLGLMLGIRNHFRKNAWWILIAIGTFNLIPVFHIGDLSSNRLALPALLIGGGIYLATRSGRRRDDAPPKLQMVTNGESSLYIDNTMGGRKEIVTSKSFRGGSIRTTFGGTEVNLMQADSTIQPIALDIHVSFGSVELIVPSHWEVINEIRPSMGSVEDHRNIRMPDGSLERRTLILRGSCSFGSLEVKSY